MWESAVETGLLSERKGVLELSLTFLLSTALVPFIFDSILSYVVGQCF